MPPELAILGGDPTFEKPFPIVKPSASRYLEDYLVDIRGILESGMLSGVNRHVKEFEDAFADYLKVSRAVAMGSNTSGLILCLSALGIRNQRIMLPSFTFSATALGPFWSGNLMTWIDVDDTLTLSEEAILDMDLSDISLIIGVHTFGNPCPYRALDRVAQSHGCHVIFDAAHALGSVCNGAKIGGSGSAEVFSLSSTKLVTSFEGGMVATNDDGLAEKIEVLRNYGNSPDYSCEIPGLNARMPEVSAALGHRMLEDVDLFVRNRNGYCDRYATKLRKLEGISFQRIREGCISSRKDFAIIVSPEEFGMTRDVLAVALEEENIMTKKYFFPPVHKLKAFRDYGEDDLPVTEEVSRKTLCLPIHNFMSSEDVDRICDSISACSEQSERVVKAVQDRIQ